MKPKMFFITNGFPYGIGEKTFVLPELESLQRFYNIVLVSSVYSQDINDEKNKTDLPASIKQYVLLKDRSILSKCFWLIMSLFDRRLYGELLEIPIEKLFLKRFINVCIYFNYVKYCECRIKKIYKNECRDQSENVLFYTFWCLEPTVAACGLKDKYSNIKVVTKMLGFDLYNERREDGRQCFRSYLNKKLDKIYFCADSMREYYLQSFRKNLKSDRCCVNIMGVKKAVDNPFSNSSSIFRIVSCSNVIPLKRVELIAQAVCKMKTYDKNIEWVHFGDGTSMNLIREIINNSQIPESTNIILKGHVASEEVIEFYQNYQVDCFITTTSTEGGEPLSMVEAMACGVPVIATDISDISKAISGNGILLSDNPSVDEVQKSLESMLGYGTNEILEMRNNSVKMWRERFNQEKLLSDLITDLHSL